MARGDKIRELGKGLDDIHTRFCDVHQELDEKLDELDGILAKELLDGFREVMGKLDSAVDDVQSVYDELDSAAVELDSDESDDESTKRELEKDLAVAQERIEELESENDDLSAAEV
jgi:uncharacterized coiled-coil DUF342 family protein